MKNQRAMARPRIEWNEERLEKFAESYPVTRNHILAESFHLSVSSIKRKARELNLIKREHNRRKCRIDAIFCELFGQCSYKQIAKTAEVSSRTVRRVSRRMNMTLQREQRNQFISISLRKGLHFEQTREIYGLARRYNRPVGRDDDRAWARRMLKESGYIVIRGNRTAYYSETMQRYPSLEQYAVSNGIILEQWG